MDSLLTMINHLIARALMQGTGAGAFQLRAVTLDADGGHVVGHFEHAQVRGEVVLRFRVEASTDGLRQSIRLRCLSVPDELGPAFAPFRRLLETARITLDLDFGEEAREVPLEEKNR